MRRGAILAGALTALATPASALAADPPTILTAGIDAADQLYATWALAPGTTFDHVDFATTAAPDPTLPSFFSSDNFAGFSSSTSTGKSPASTSHVASYPIARDRRYYVKVTAATGVAGEGLTSAIWIIDETKPEIPGDAPLGPIPPTNQPATGRLLTGTAPPPGPPPAPVPPPAPAPAAALKILATPKTFTALRTKGARVQVGCTVGVPCTAVATLTLNGVRIGRRSTTLASGGLRTVVVKPSVAGRRRLARRSRAVLKVSGRVTPLGGAAKTASKRFTVRRR